MGSGGQRSGGLECVQAVSVGKAWLSLALALELAGAGFWLQL
jgi:hypothetical protein